MRNRHLLALLLILTLFSTSVFAQQININATTACSGSISHFTVPPFTLPASTNIEYYTFYAGGDTVTTTENEYSGVFAPGIYTASAKIVLSNGSSVNTPVISFSIAAPPIANFSLNGTIFCINSDSAVCITNTSVQTTFPIKQYLIEWGTAMSDSVNPNFVSKCYKYPFPGSFFIALRAIDSIGCKSDTFFPVTVKDQIIPQIAWSGDIRCSGSLFKFTNTFPGGNTSPGSVKSYSWDFGDGQTYSATRPFTALEAAHIDSISHNYTTHGIFTPALSITDTNGCNVLLSKNYPQGITLPGNIVSNGKILSSRQYLWWDSQAPDEQVFCHQIKTSNSIYFSPPKDLQFAFDQNGPYAYWTFDDPASMQQNEAYYYFPGHNFITEGKHIVTLDLSATFPNCIFYDTIELVGPTARIENPQIGIGISPEQKNQVKGTDTVDFVNTTLNDGVTNKINFVWDFDDMYAPVCSSYSTPKPGAVLPFNNAKEQYENSNHYYVRNGITYSGKMNCRWSLDSLPRHKYTNWDSVYTWMVNGKTFPPSWGLAPISAGTPIVINGSFSIPDPFLLAQGKTEILQNGTLSSRFANYTYMASDGSIVVHNGMDVIPNSSQTFHQFIFDYMVMRNYGVSLTAIDSLGKGCVSDDKVVLKFGRPKTYGIRIGGKECPGRAPDGAITFDFSNLNNTFLLINFDSLADKTDATPCTIDGFVNFQGGITPGGLNYPPFFSQPNFSPPGFWYDGAGTKLYYHYGYNAPTNRPPPADTANGFVTIGVIIGTGCANPPFCTEAEVYSDTLWFHNALQIQNINSGFALQNRGQLFSKGDMITVVPEANGQTAIKYDMWGWGDGSYTVDSFRYASDYNLPNDITDGYFVNGRRRVRYQFESTDNITMTLVDSMPFPNGLPGTNLTNDTVTNSKCPSSTSVTIIQKDSAMMLLPITHKLQKSSYELSNDPHNPTISYMVRALSNVNGCSNMSSSAITIGIIDSISISGNTPNGSTFCNGETLAVKGFARYFRCDNTTTSLPINPNYSCATNTYYGAPYDQFNFDTLDFWNLNKNNSANIKYTYLNPSTNKTDTIYYEKMFWNFGDGSPIVTGLNATHKYNTSGTYTLSMITRDSMGGWDTCSKQIIIGAPVAKINLPRESFPPYQERTVFNCGENVALSDSGFVANNSNNPDSIKTNYWWFGDAHDTIDWQLKNAKQPVHSYTSNGSFNIKLVTESMAGCKDTDYVRIFTRGPRPYFKVISNNIGCIPYTVTLVNDADVKRKFVSSNGTTFPNDTPTFSTYFDFGDQSPQEIAMRHDTIVHTYTTPGQFFITAYGSDALAGMQNYCPLVAFPDAQIDTAVFITVTDISTNGIVGKSKVALSETQQYSVARSTYATYSWSVVGGTIANGQTSNTATINWSTTDGHYRLVCTKKSATCTSSDTLIVAVGNTTGMDDETKQLNQTFTIFPNPASNNFTVKWNKPVTESVQVQLFDVVGKNYLSETIQAAGAGEYSFDIHSLKPGIYFIGIQYDGEHHTYKLLIE